MIDLPTASTVFCFCLPHSTCTETRAVRVRGVDREAVAGVDDVLVAQVEHDELAMTREQRRSCSPNLGLLRGRAPRARRRRAARGPPPASRPGTSSMSIIIRS